MELKKFEQEVETLKKFSELYCKDKHSNQKILVDSFKYKSKDFILSLELCEDCKKHIHYSLEKLQNCIHEIKPRCRNCPNPCYDKNEWKYIAKMMKYSAIKFSFSKIKSKVKNMFNSGIK